MTFRAISEIALNTSGRLLVKPAAPAESDSMIYRAGAGVQWDADALAFIAAEPERWRPLELARQIKRAVLSELGDDLGLTTATKWSGVPSQLRSELVNELRNAGAADA